MTGFIVFVGYLFALLAIGFGSQRLMRGTGADSPVRADMSTSISPETRRASADIRSPSPTRTRSPGPRSAASTVAATPSRTTRVAMGMTAARPPPDPSPRPPCRKAYAAFR